MNLPEGDFYFVADYGYGDGACHGPMTAYEALAAYTKYKERKTPEESLAGWQAFWVTRTRAPLPTMRDLFDSNLIKPGYRRTCYITDQDCSEDFENFPDS